MCSWPPGGHAPHGDVVTVAIGQENYQMTDFGVGDGLPAIAPHAGAVTHLAWSLIVFAVAAVPGYILAFMNIDRIGHRRLQLIGFTFMGLAFLAMGIIPGITTMVAPFLLIYGLSYFFAEFGPNTTTFILSAELFPVSLRTTGHGFSAGIAKVGAFIGVFVFPFLTHALGLSGTLTVTFVFSAVGVLLTLLLPEPARQSMESLTSNHKPAKEEVAVLEN